MCWKPGGFCRPEEKLLEGIPAVRVPRSVWKGNDRKGPGGCQSPGEQIFTPRLGCLLCWFPIPERWMGCQGSRPIRRSRRGKEGFTVGQVVKRVWVVLEGERFIRSDYYHSVSGGQIGEPSGEEEEEEVKVTYSIPHQQHPGISRYRNQSAGLGARFHRP